MTIFGKILIPFDYYLGFIKYLAKLRAYFGINFYVIREIFIMPNGQIYEKLRYCQLVTTDLVIVVVTVNVVVVVVVVVGVVVVINIVVNVVRVYPEKVIKCFKLCRNCQERKIARGRG